MNEKHIGRVTQVIGPVVDVRFPENELPRLLNAIEIDIAGRRLVVEVSQHIGDNTVRCIAMSSTDGLVRGTEAVDTGRGITVPVGEKTLGRIFNVLGEPVDEKESPDAERWEIHRPAPGYEDQRSEKSSVNKRLRRLRRGFKCFSTLFVEVGHNIFIW